MSDDSDQDIPSKMEILGTLKAVDAGAKTADNVVKLGSKIFTWFKTQLAEDEKTLKRELDEQLSELHDIKGQISDIVKELRRCKQENTVPDEKKPKAISKREFKLHKQLSKNIRRAHYLGTQKIPDTFGKLENITDTVISGIESNEQMQSEIIYIDPKSGIDVKLLVSRIEKPLNKFTTLFRFCRNRCPCSSCFGYSHKAPHIKDPINNKKLDQIIFKTQIPDKTNQLADPTVVTSTDSLPVSPSPTVQPKIVSPTIPSDYISSDDESTLDSPSPAETNNCFDNGWCDDN